MSIYYISALLAHSLTHTLSLYFSPSFPRRSLQFPLQHYLSVGLVGWFVVTFKLNCEKKPPLAAPKNARVLSLVHNSNGIPLSADSYIERGLWFNVFPPWYVSRPAGPPPAAMRIIRLINANRFKTARCFRSTVVKSCDHIITYYIVKRMARVRFLPVPFPVAASRWRCCIRYNFGSYRQFCVWTLEYRSVALGGDWNVSDGRQGNRPCGVYPAPSIISEAPEKTRKRPRFWRVLLFYMNKAWEHWHD